MAGFDLNIPVIPSEREIAKTTLKYVQRVAVTYGLQFTYRWRELTKIECSNYYVTIDGQLTSIESFSRFLMGSIPYFVEGLCSGLRKKSMLGVVIPTSIIRRLDQFVDGLYSLVGSFNDLSGDSQVGSLIFNTSGLKHLEKPVKQLTELYYKYDHSQVCSEVLIEHIHTVMESLLKVIYKKSDCAKDLVALANYAESQNLLSESEFQTVDFIRNIRNKSKHKSQGIKNKTANKILMPSARIIHKLICKAQQNA